MSRGEDQDSQNLACNKYLNRDIERTAEPRVCGILFRKVWKSGKVWEGKTGDKRYILAEL